MGSTVDNSGCTPWFDECNAKQNLSVLQILKLLVKKDVNGCPVIGTDASVSLSNISIALGGTERTKETRNVIAAGAGVINAGARKVDIVNYGDADALVDGVVLPSGLSIPYLAGLNDTLPAFAYNAQTSKLFITIIS